MRSGARAWVLLSGGALLLGALGPGCKDGGSGGQDSRPLPTPEPPATASTELPKDAAPPPKKRPADDDAAKPKRAPAEEPADKAPSAGGTSSVPAPSDAADSAAPAASTPPLVPPCMARCQGAMQGCLSAPVDGGVPGFSNLELCKKAFEACQSACAKP